LRVKVSAALPAVFEAVLVVLVSVLVVVSLSDTPYPFRGLASKNLVKLFPGFFGLPKYVSEQARAVDFLVPLRQPGSIYAPVGIPPNPNLVILATFMHEPVAPEYLPNFVGAWRQVSPREPA
jgi:hypothetical protein